jgi:hypothetical protein
VRLRVERKLKGKVVETKSERKSELMNLKERMMFVL